MNQRHPSIQQLKQLKIPERRRVKTNKKKREKTKNHHNKKSKVQGLRTNSITFRINILIKCV